VQKHNLNSPQFQQEINLTIQAKSTQKNKTFPLQKLAESMPPDPA